MKPQHSLYIVLTLLVLLLGAVWMFDPYGTGRVQAAPAALPDDCPIVGKAGGTNVYRCEDYEMGTVCYVNNYGFLFCLTQ